MGRLRRTTPLQTAAVCLMAVARSTSSRCHWYDTTSNDSGLDLLSCAENQLRCGARGGPAAREDAHIGVCGCAADTHSTCIVHVRALSAPSTHLEDPTTYACPVLTAQRPPAMLSFMCTGSGVPACVRTCRSLAPPATCQRASNPRTCTSPRMPAPPQVPGAWALLPLPLMPPVLLSPMLSLALLLVLTRPAPARAWLPARPQTRVRLQQVPPAPRSTRPLWMWGRLPAVPGPPRLHSTTARPAPCTLA